MVDTLQQLPYVSATLAIRVIGSSSVPLVSARRPVHRRFGVASSARSQTLCLAAREARSLCNLILPRLAGLVSCSYSSLQLGAVAASLSTLNPNDHYTLIRHSSFTLMLLLEIFVPGQTFLLPLLDTTSRAPRTRRGVSDNHVWELKVGLGLYSSCDGGY
jgi:hypothetical protein